jgi:hypothetical protein
MQISTSVGVAHVICFFLCSRIQTDIGRNSPTHKTAKPPRRYASLGSNPNNMAALRRALEDAGVEFIERSKTKGRGLGCMKLGPLGTAHAPIYYPVASGLGKLASFGPHVGGPGVLADPGAFPYDSTLTAPVLYSRHGPLSCHGALSAAGSVL